MVGDYPRVGVSLYRIVLGRQAESVKADGKKDVVALKPSLPRDDLKTRIRLDVADVHTCAAGVREFDKAVEFRL